MKNERYNLSFNESNIEGNVVFGNSKGDLHYSSSTDGKLVETLQNLRSEIDKLDESTTTSTVSSTDLSHIDRAVAGEQVERKALRDSLVRIRNGLTAATAGSVTASGIVALTERAIASLSS